MPPMNIFVKDHRQFGRKPTVGVHVLKALEQYRVDPLAEVNSVVAGIDAFFRLECLKITY